MTASSILRDIIYVEYVMIAPSRVFPGENPRKDDALIVGGGGGRSALLPWRPPTHTEGA